MGHRVTIQPRYYLRIEHFQVGHESVATCLQCGHVGHIPAVVLHKSQPGYRRILDVQGKLRCRSCGRAGAVDWHVEEVKHTPSG